MSDIECPYCNAGEEVCHDDGQGYEEDKKHEMMCGECGLSFVFTTHISFYYEPAKAPCLNGEQHNLSESKSFPRRYTKMRCEDCDYSEALPPNHEYLKETT